MAASSAALRRAASSFSRCHPIHPHVRCDRAQGSGVSKQKLKHALERAHVPGGKGAGGGSDAQTEGAGGHAYELELLLDLLSPRCFLPTICFFERFLLRLCFLLDFLLLEAACLPLGS